MKNIIFISICILLNCACSKSNNPAPDNPYGLPNATQTGANVFACRINGKNFISYYSIYGTKAGFYSDTFGMNGTITNTSLIQSLNFTIYTNQQIGVSYDFKQNLARSIYATDSTCLGFSSAVIKSNAMSGFIKLTKYNKNLKIISGEFEANYPLNNCDTIKVTDGRFDFNYY